MFTYVVRTIHDDEEVCTYMYPKVSRPNPKSFKRYYEVIADKEFYKKEHIGQKDNLSKLVEEFSYYSLVFYEDPNKNTGTNNESIHFLQTNKSSNSNLYKYFLPERVEKRESKGDMRRCGCWSLSNEAKENEETNNFLIYLERLDQVYEMTQEEKEKSLWNPRLLNLISVPPRSRLYLFQYPNFKGRTFVFENLLNSNNIFQIQMSSDDDVSSYKWYTMHTHFNKFEMDDNLEIFRPKLISVENTLGDSNTEQNPDINLPIFTLLSDPNTRTIISKLHDA